MLPSLPLNQEEEAMKRAALTMIVCTFSTACVSERVAFPTSPVRASEQIVGRVEGVAGGFMLFGFVPIGQNDRFQRAYVNAMQQAPSGSRLVNVQCWENWYWAYVGNGYVFHVSADCVLPRPSGTQ